MSYQVFARKYRPKTFDDVIGQEHITRTLKNAIEKQRLAHAYIFVGPRGTGKTSTARILAMALNCSNGPKVDFNPDEDICREIAEGRSMDVLEFDAASNTQVEKIREIIIDNVKYAPTRGKYKMYIVDEVHMLSNSSFNALLKTLEEPPDHVKFVFATTDVQKVPTTILSRCQRFDLKRIPPSLIRKHLLFIAEQEKVALSPAAAETIARGAEGGMRDAESMLDQLVAFCGNQIEESDVLNVFGFTGQQTVSALCDHLLNDDAPAALKVVQEQAEAGRDLMRLNADLITHLRNLLIAKADPGGLADELSAETVATLTAQAGRIAMDRLLELIEQFAEAEGKMKWAPNKKMHLEIAVIRAIQSLNQATLTDVLDHLTALRGGKAPPSSSESARPTLSKAAPKSVAKAAAPTPRPVKTKEAKEAAPLPAAAPEPAPLPPPPVSVKNEEAPPEPAPLTEPVSAPKESAPAKQESAALDPSGSNDLAAIWAAAVQEIRSARPSLRLWVQSGTLGAIDGDEAVILFPPEQTLAADHFREPANCSLIEQVLSKLAGRTLKLRCDLREGVVVAPVPVADSPEANKTETAPDLLEEFKNDPLIRKAIELFKAEVQPA